MLPRAAKQSLAVSPAHSFDSTTLTEAEIRRLAARFGSPLLVVDCEQVRRQYRALRAALPGVDLHYALKPLPHASVVATLRDEGAFFDLATTGEVELVKATGRCPGALHPHAPDQARQRHPRRAALRRHDVRRRQPGRDPQVRALPQARRAAAARLLPQPDGRLRPVEEVRLRAGRGARPDRNRAPTGRARARPVVPRRLAGDRSFQVHRGDAGLHEPHRRGAAGRSAVAGRARHRRRLPGALHRGRDADRRVLRARSARRSRSCRSTCASSPSRAASLPRRPRSPSAR